MERNKGVTLIALIITIIVLLILAGVSISILTGDNGVLTKATTVELEYSKAEIEEAFGLQVNEKLMEAYSIVQDTNEDISTQYKESTLIPYFSSKYMTKDADAKVVQDVLGEMTGENALYSVYIINPLSLSDKVDLYGKGTEKSDNDVFTLEVKTTEDGKSTGEYELKYYDADGNSEVLSTYLLYRTNNS